MNKKKKVYVGISGGVDSAVAAFLLGEEGFNVKGVYMRLNNPINKEEEKNAESVCKKLGIEFIIFDFRKEFKEKIINYFIEEYCCGKTPNPCVKCNKDFKFGLFLKKALSEGADFVATGHYAKIRTIKKTSKNYGLFIPKDKSKDQTYFLYNLKKSQLKKIIFPLADLLKEDVRKIAIEKKLVEEQKVESQEICFIKEKYYSDFLKKQKIDFSSGDIVNKEGKILGKHKGLPLYTLGQRRDIGIGGTGPYYVVGMNYKKNELIVSSDANDDSILKRKFTLKMVNLLHPDFEYESSNFRVKIRYRSDFVSGKIYKENHKWFVVLNKRTRGIMPGQSAVFYAGKEVVGGGVINKIIE